MYIGWNAQYGYLPSGNLTNINQATWVDKNARWCIYTTKDGENEDITGQPYDPSILYSFVAKYIGNNVDGLYFLVGGPPNYYGGYDIIKSAFPSLFLNAPILSEIIENKLGVPLVYIPSLKLVSFESSFAHVDSSGNLIDNFKNVNGFDGGAVCSASLGIRNQFSVRLSLLTDYTGPSDLVDINKRRYILLSGHSYSFSDELQTTFLKQIGPSYQSYLNFVFGSSGTAPDFEGDGPFEPDNPYEPGGSSGEGGGGGTFDGDSDQIPDSSLPTLSAADTGFTRLYTPTLSQVQDLARYLWTDESIIETLWNVVKRYFEDPMQAFISFSIVPVPVPVAGVEDFKVLFIPTGVMLNTVANQFVDVDCGTFEMKEYYGSALDYSPNTKVSCYLPYIGTVSLNTDDVMGRTLQVKYRVDICSGSCVAKILVDGNVIYQFPGCCSVPIPFTSADFSSYGSAIISAVKTGVALAAAGAGATELGANIIGMNATQQTGESYTKTTVDTVRNPATGRQITAGTQKITKEVTGTKASFSGIAQTGLANTANSVTASKTIVERSGSFSGNSGYLGVRRPYLIIERPRMCMPANYQQLNGFPSMMSIALSECKGYTRVQQIQLTGVEATNPEQAEILELLKGGVIL